MIDYQRLVGFASAGDATEAVEFRNAAVGAKIGKEEEAAPIEMADPTSHLGDGNQTSPARP